MMSVTQILSDIYPFNSQESWITWLNRELESLWKSPVDYDSIMRTTQVTGDIIHTYFIEKAMGFPTVDLPEMFRDLQKPIDDFIAEHNISWLICEFRIEKPNEYIWHPDLVVMKNWKWEKVKALCDIKTYGLYRKLLGLPEKNLVKLNGNMQKVSLQTSMYRDAIIFSKHNHIKAHWDVSKLFCYHIKHTGVEAFELKYDVSKYLQWKQQ